MTTAREVVQRVLDSRKPLLRSCSPCGDPMGIEHYIEWDSEAVADAVVDALADSFFRPGEDGGS